MTRGDTWGPLYIFMTASCCIWALLLCLSLNLGCGHTMLLVPSERSVVNFCFYEYFSFWQQITNTQGPPSSKQRNWKWKKISLSLIGMHFFQISWVKNHPSRHLNTESSKGQICIGLSKIFRELAIIHPEENFSHDREKLCFVISLPVLVCDSWNKILVIYF